MSGNSDSRTTQDVATLSNKNKNTNTNKGVAGNLNKVWNNGEVVKGRIFLNIILQTLCGTRWRSRFRHYATSRKAAGSIPDGVIGIWH
jgi:hypothetical protein